VGPGSPKYDDAYFEINYVRAYTTGGPAPTATPLSTRVDPNRSGTAAALPQPTGVSSGLVTSVNTSSNVVAGGVDTAMMGLNCYQQFPSLVGHALLGIAPI
jgi:hypothetical protein